METLELINKLEHFYVVWGYPLIFVSSFIETTPFGWTIPGGSMIAMGGFFAYSQSISLFGVIIAAWLGQWSTFMFAYLIGHKSGTILISKLNQKENANKAKELLNKHGGAILTTSMMANFTRFWISYAAGAQKYNLAKFTFYSSAASLTWTSLMVVIGYIAGAQRIRLESGLAGLGIAAWLVIIATLAVVYWKSKKEYKLFKKGRK